MKKNFLFQLLLAAFLLPAFSCSDDDSAPEINNATTLNMLDVENGATRLGNSDIYINAANNFQTNECLIAEIGPSKGIGKVIPPQVGNGLVYQAAVTPGHLYQAFKEEAVKQIFHPGKNSALVGWQGRTTTNSQCSDPRITERGRKGVKALVHPV